MGAYTIEDNVPLPDDYKEPAKRGKYDFIAEMKNGQSVFLPDHKAETVQQAVNNYKRGMTPEEKLKNNFVSVARVEKGLAGVRLWKNPHVLKEISSEEEIASIEKKSSEA